MASWIITIGGKTPEHWDIAKRKGFWDFAQGPGVSAGDTLYFWQSRIDAKTPGHIVGAVQATSGEYDSTGKNKPWTLKDERRNDYNTRVDITPLVTQTVASPTAQQLADWNYVPRNPANGSAVMTNGRFKIDDPNVERVQRRLTNATFKGVDLVFPADNIALEEPTATKSAVTQPTEPFDADALEGDGREEVTRTIRARRGQGKFRADVLNAYANRCAVTGCTTESVLDAAHILGYKGTHTNRVDNGLLLRTDIHTLFDYHQLTFVYVDDNLIVRVATGIDDEYRKLDGREVALPKDVGLRPHPDAIRKHQEACAWLNLVD